MDEYKKVLNNEQWHEVPKNITLNNWIGGLLIGGVFIVLLSVLFYAGMFMGSLVTWLTS